MTATDELRRMLDERGVEYETEDIPSPSVGLYITSWHADGITWEARSRGKRLYLGADRLLTPAQAIAATLGPLTEKVTEQAANDTNAGKCQLKPWEMERDTGFYDCMECACGYVADVADWAEWCYCPSCGRKVVDE